MTERKPLGMSEEAYVEQLLQDARAAGNFENLPGFGQPIPGIDEPHDPDWWVKEKLKRERLATLPPALEAKADIHRTLGEIEALQDEAAVRQKLIELNQRIRQALFAIRWGPGSEVQELDIEQAVAQWRKR